MTFRQRLNNRVFYLSAFVLLAVMASGLYMMTDGTAVSAQRGDISSRGETNKGVKGEIARADMLAFALNMRSAGDYTAFGQKGLRGEGVSNLRGRSGTGSDEASLGENGSGVKARSDLSKSFSAINQLPCQDIGSELTGGSFTPGVYCAPSAALAQQMILNAGGDENGIFIFRTSGGMKTTEGFQMTLENGARADNVFFVSGDTASIAEWGMISGNIIARNTVDVGKGATVKGRALSTEGEVILGEASNLVLQTGVLQICKFAVGTDPNDQTFGLGNRIFRFEVGGTIYEAPVGGCTGPITLPTGVNTITELNDGRFTNQPGTWSGRFRLVNVTTSVAGALGPVNLPARTANVTIREGTISNQTVVNFFNTFAISGVIEICKRATLTAPIDPDVTGFFDFTVDAIPNTVFTVPVGQCTGAITVLVPATPGPVPQPARIRVTELAEAGFTLEAASTFPASRFVSLTLNSGITNSIACSTIGFGSTAGCTFTNNGGGFVTADVLEGGTSNQTTINFFNRTNPGVVKVCKIAGPGIPEGTLFRFEVRGTAPTAPAPAGPILPGVEVVRIVDVHAGPAAQGGFCDFVRESDGSLSRFIIGSNVLVRELGALEPIPGVPPGAVRVSRIRLDLGLTGFVAAPVTVGGITTNPNPDLTPNADIVGTTTINETDLARAVFMARAETREIEFTNFVFNPTLLKICKIAGAGITQGTPFTFTVEILNTGGFPFGNQTNLPIGVPNVTVQAGPAASGGFCQFATGPFDPTATTPPIGTFPVGATVRVCENTAAGTTLTGITSPTGVPSPVAGQPRCSDLTLGFANGFNELIFTNIAGSPVSTGFTLSGRVMTPDGGGLRNAQVILVGADGSKFSVPTNSMGYYSFDSLSSQAYRATVASRRYKFEAKDIELNDSLSAVDFTGLE